MPGRNQIASADGRLKYIGVEQDVETNYLATKSRLYDMWRGGWLGVDPMTEIYPGMSPYQYSHNNPINFLDPGGMMDTSANGNYSQMTHMPTVDIWGDSQLQTNITNSGAGLEWAAQYCHNYSKAATVAGIITGVAGFAWPPFWSVSASLFTLATTTEGGSLAVRSANYRINNVGDPKIIVLDGVKWVVFDLGCQIALVRLENLAKVTSWGFRGLGGKFVSESFSNEVGLARIGIESGLLQNATFDITNVFMNSSPITHNIPTSTISVSDATKVVIIK
jgi:RHS repeat-associated protein